MRKINIRPIEERDKGNYLRLFQNEDFGCIGINSDLKPTIYEEERILSGVLNGSIISTAILVIEENNDFIGYATISRPSKHKYHVGEFVIRKDKQRQGYGTMLMNEIKEYAASDDASIALECISNGTDFFKKQGFENCFSSTYIYTIKKKSINKKKLFIDYEIIESERRKIEEEEIKTFQKFLNSAMFKEIMKL